MKQFVVLLLALGLSQSAHAQLLNKLKERATSTVRSVVPGSSSSSSSSVGGAVADQAAQKVSEATEKENIIFSKEPFKEGQTTSTATDFLPTDNIYARVLLPRTIYEQLEERGKEDSPGLSLTIGLTTDVESGMQTVTQYNYCTIAIPASDFKKRYFDLDVLPALNHISTHYEGQGGTKDHLSTIFTYFGEEPPAPTIPFGKRRFKMEFGDKMAVGYFTLAVSNWKEKKPLDARIEAIRTGVDNAVAKDTKLPDVFRAGGKFNDPQLSLANIKQLLGPVLKIAIEPGNVDYTIHKNDLGVPVDKVTRPIWVVYKDGGNCYYKRCYLIRHYEGGGKYGTLDVAATTAENVQIACENVK